MNYSDYRQILGLGFEDKDKAKLFINCVLNYLDLHLRKEGNRKYILRDDYLSFCNNVGCGIVTNDCKFR